MKVLVVEDDSDSLAVLTLGLVESGQQVAAASNFPDGLALAISGGFDALIIDRGLPEGDGIGIVAALRARQIMTPVIFLTAMNDVKDRISGLRAGGDDYIAKPFSFLELLARLEAITRRKEAVPATVLRVGDLEINMLTREVKRGSVEIALQPREYRLLEFLLIHAGQTVTRSMLLEGVWKYNFEPETKIIDVQMSRLRQKINRGFDKPLIHTVRGSGYCIRAN